MHVCGMNGNISALALSLSLGVFWGGGSVGGWVGGKDGMRWGGGGGGGLQLREFTLQDLSAVLERIA